MLFNSHRQYVKVGRRMFAVPRPLGLADRIASQTQVRTNWVRDADCAGRAVVVQNIRR